MPCSYPKACRLCGLDPHDCATIWTGHGAESSAARFYRAGYAVGYQLAYVDARPEPERAGRMREMLGKLRVWISGGDGVEPPR